MYSNLIGEVLVVKLSKFRLRVFISSAMSEENGLNWKVVRENVKDTLKGCEYLEPFTIEDHTSEIPSTQFFTWQVKQTDVIVILVKNILRPGTRQEIEMALKEKKPILVYFCDSESQDNSVLEFLDFLRTSDLCTYKTLKSFENVSEIVKNDLINNMINYYRYRHDISNGEQEFQYFSDNVLLENSIVDKKMLSYFGNNHNSLLELFSLSSYSIKKEEIEKENNIGEKLLKWLYNGNCFISEEEVKVMWNHFSLPESTVNVLNLRYQAMNKYFNKNYESALIKLNDSYETAEKEKLPNWLLGEILIDSRNINSNLEIFEQTYQEKISDLDYFIHFPVGDRVLKQAFEVMEKERLTISTQSVDTIRYGNTLLESMHYIKDYLYISFITGSSTHLLLARKKMIEILVGYGDIYNDENLIYQGLRLMILSGEKKMFLQVLDKYWERVSEGLAINVRELWALTEKKYCINNEVMKCLIIKSLGQYMDNALFRNASSFLLNYSNKFESHEKAMELTDAVSYNLLRLEHGFTLNILVNIVKSNKIIVYNKITKLLSAIDLEKCDVSELKGLSAILKEKIEIILKNNGSPYFIINLVKHNSDIFGELLNIIKLSVTPSVLDVIENELEQNKKNNEVLINNIEKLEERFITDTSVLIGYADDPIRDIIGMLNEFNSSEQIDILNERFIPLVIKVLSSNATLEIKEPYLLALITLLVKYSKENQEIDVNLKELFSSNEIELNNKFDLGRVSVTSSMYYIKTISFLLGINNEDIIFTACIDYKKRSKKEREAFSFSIQKYIELQHILSRKIPLFINLVVLDLLKDEYFLIRKNMLKCLMFIYDISPSEFLKGELVRMTLDSSPNVKGYYIELLKLNIINKSISEELLELFSKDASYTIRNLSKK